MIRPTQDVLDALSLPAFVLEPDPHGKPVFKICNTTWFKVVDRTPAQTYGRSVQEVFDGQYGKHAFAHHVTAFEDRKSVTYDLTMPVQNTLRQIATTLTPLLDDAGQVEYVLGTTHDNTATKYAMDLEQKVTTLKREIEDFMTFAMRDVAQPLRDVSDVAHQLQDGFVDMGDGKLALIKRLADVSGEAANMVSDLLDRARATAIVNLTEKFELQDLIDTMVQDFDARDIPFLVADPAVVSANRTALTFILHGLLADAFHASSPRLKWLDIAAYPDASGMIALSLNAPDFVFAKAARVFDQSDGVGLITGDPLTAAAQMIYNEGGDIFAEIDNGESLVQFTFPGEMQPLARPQAAQSGGKQAASG